MTKTERQKLIKAKMPQFIKMPEETEKKMEFTINILKVSDLEKQMIRAMCMALFHTGINRGVDMVDEISKGLHE